MITYSPVTALSPASAPSHAPARVSVCTLIIVRASSASQSYFNYCGCGLPGLRITLPLLPATSLVRLNVKRMRKCRINSSHFENHLN